jgi:hypothetical protein
VPYKLSNAEAALYRAVTDYVREEFDQAETLAGDEFSLLVNFLACAGGPIPSRRQGVRYAEAPKSFDHRQKI